MSGTYQRVSAVLTDVEGIEGCSSVVQHLPSMYEAQVLIPSTPKKKKLFKIRENTVLLNCQFDKDIWYILSKPNIVFLKGHLLSRTYPEEGERDIKRLRAMSDGNRKGKWV